MSDTGKKGQNSSSHHPDRERERNTVKKKYIYTYSKVREREGQRWTDGTKKTERLKQTGRHEKRDRWIERQ